MLILNECRISEDGKTLIVEATVDSLEYYDRIYISQLIIDTEKTWTASGPSSNPVYNIEFSKDDSVASTICGPVVTENAEDGCCGNVITGTYGKKHIRLHIDAKDMNLPSFNDHILFVYIYASGYPDPSTPCGMDNEYITGIAINLRPLYNYAMGYIKSVGASCEIPKGFIDYFLKYKALTLALKTGNYPDAFKMWEYLHSSKGTVNTTRRGCGCNGK